MRVTRWPQVTHGKPPTLTSGIKCRPTLTSDNSRWPQVTIEGHTRWPLVQGVHIFFFIITYLGYLLASPPWALLLLRDMYCTVGHHWLATFWWPLTNHSPLPAPGGNGNIKKKYRNAIFQDTLYFLFIKTSHYIVTCYRALLSHFTGPYCHMLQGPI